MIRLRDSRDNNHHDINSDMPMSIYSCGYTPREPIHLGNARPFYLADMLRRVARIDHHSVELVQDISDIDARVEDASVSARVPLEQFVRKRTEQFMADGIALGIYPADRSPIASAHMHDIIALIERLSARGLTSEDDESISLSIPDALRNYDLAHLDPTGVIHSMMCFTGKRWDYRQKLLLWDKRATPAWESPWGPGRPDENIPCVALAHAYLAAPMTVHVGSVDIYSHHEIEMAVGSLDSGTEYATTWIHSGVVEVNGRRMANSADNVRFVRDAVTQYGGASVRLLYLTTSYRETLDASTTALQESRSRVARLRDLLVDAPALGGTAERFRSDFLSLLRDDLRTPDAVSELESALCHGLTQKDAEFAVDLLGLTHLLGGIRKPVVSR